MRLIKAMACSPYTWMYLGLSLVWLLGGCATKPEAPVVQRVSVPVAVECQEPMPAKPLLPVDALTPDAPLDTVVRSMIASIERQSGYIVQLEAALTNCRRPLRQTTYGLTGQFNFPSKE